MSTLIEIRRPHQIGVLEYSGVSQILTFSHSHILTFSHTHMLTFMFTCSISHILCWAAVRGFDCDATS